MCIIYVYGHIWYITHVAFHGTISGVLFFSPFFMYFPEMKLKFLGLAESAHTCRTVSSVPFLPILQHEIKKTEETLVCFCLPMLLTRLCEVNLHYATHILVEIMVGISVSLVQN